MKPRFHTLLHARSARGSVILGCDVKTKKSSQSLLLMDEIKSHPMKPLDRNIAMAFNGATLAWSQPLPKKQKKKSRWTRFASYFLSKRCASFRATSSSLMDPSTLIRFHRYHTWFYRRIHLLTFILTDIGQFEEDADQGKCELEKQNYRWD